MPIWNPEKTDFYDEINLYGTARVYDGHFLDATDFKAPASGAATKVNRGIGVAYEFADASVENIYTQYRIPGKWVDTEDITVILLWDSPTTSSDCDWEVHYQFKALDEAMDDSTATGNVTFTESSSGITKGLVESQLTIPTADFDSGDKMIRLRVTRDGTTDTLGDSAFLHAILMKGIANKLGGST